VAIAPDGIFVYSQFKNNIPKGKAQINVEASVLNTLTNAAKVTVKSEVFSPEGKLVGKDDETENVNRSSTHTLKLDTSVSSPVLWSPESPKLYKLVTTVSVDGKLVDRKETEFGIRTVGFDK